MYRTIHVDINKKHPMYDYFKKITTLTNNMYNATLFRMRQVMTGVKKPESERQENEREVFAEIERNLAHMTGNRKMPTESRWRLGYSFLCALFHASDNPDYTADGLPKQTAQLAVKQATKDMKAYVSACRGYRSHPENFSGKPKLPHYKKSGGHCKATFTNQDCVFCHDDNGKCFIKFPFTKVKLCIGVCSGTLKEVSVTPYYDVYRVFVVIDDSNVAPELKEPKRIIAIDLGVDNFAAITNNISEPSQLFKGGVIKSANQWFNKRMSAIVSEQTKGTTKKFKPTPESIALCRNRDYEMNDFMHKVAKNIIDWCVEHQIDTVVIGENKGWKNGINIGHVNNQTFVQIPFNRFKEIMTYLCEYNGIRLVFQEESYTSKASFLDNDPIPCYGDDGAHETKFSGRRRPTAYKGMSKVGGFRGLYKSKDGTIINSDLNGSANIGRKAFPEMFTKLGVAPKFDDVVIIVHPDLARGIALRKRQLAENTGLSKSKRSRIARKLLKHKNVAHIG